MGTLPVVGVVTAMWKRHELTDIVFSNIAALKEELRNEIDIRPVVAGSEGESSRAVALKHGFAYTDVPNSPLGAKWNAALRLLRGTNIDGVCIIGSDDLLNAAYFRMAAASIRSGEKLFGIDSFYVLDRFSGRMFNWLGYPPPRHEEPIGLGRFIHRDYLEALNWTLWKDHLENGLDAGMRRRIEALAELTDMPSIFSFKPAAEHNIVAVDIKHEQQMWPYEITALSSMHINMIGDAETLLAPHFNSEMLARIFAPCPDRPHLTKDIYLPEWKLAGGAIPASAYEAPMTQLALSMFPDNPTSIYVPFALRRNISYITAHETLEDNFFSLLTTFAAARPQLPAVQLHVYSELYDTAELSEYGIFQMFDGHNTHIWRNLFRVFILEADYGNALLTQDLLRHGNVVICLNGMRDFIDNAQANVPFMVDTPEQAVQLAFRLHENEALWNAASKAGKACT